MSDDGRKLYRRFSMAPADRSRYGIMARVLDMTAARWVWLMGWAAEAIDDLEKSILQVEAKIGKDEARIGKMEREIADLKAWRMDEQNKWKTPAKQAAALANIGKANEARALKAMQASQNTTPEEHANA